MIPFAICVLIALAIIPYIVQMCYKHELYDIPNGRKIHKIAIPRLGGIIFMPVTAIGMMTSLMLMNKGHNGEVEFYLSSFLMIVGAMLIYIIGLIDDLRGLKASHKFIIQTIAAIIFPVCNLMINNLHGLFGIYELPIWISYPLTVFTILLIVNAMNLIDGIDGLSSSISILMLLVFAILFHQLDAPLFVSLSISLAGTLIGFFYYNYYGRIGKNKIFMGDTGSLFIGFVIAYLAIKYQMRGWSNITNGDASLLTSITLVFIPCIDVIRVALTRLLKGKKMFAPDQTHIHHIIMQMGLNMHHALYTILIIYIVIGILNWGLYVSNVNINWIFLTDLFIYFLFIWCAEKIGSTK